MITVHIPCKEYVKRYLEFHFGKTVILTREHFIGKYFFKVLEEASEHRDTEYTRYPEEVIIRISEDVVLTKGTVLTKTGIIDFNGFVEDIMKTLMIVYIEGAMDFAKPKKTEAFDRFKDKFKIPEDAISRDSLYKAYGREKMKLFPQNDR